MYYMFIYYFYYHALHALYIFFYQALYHCHSMLTIQHSHIICVKQAYYIFLEYMHYISISTQMLHV